MLRGRGSQAQSLDARERITATILVDALDIAYTQQRIPRLPLPQEVRAIDLPSSDPFAANFLGEGVGGRGHPN